MNNRRPPFFQETISQQQARLAVELDKGFVHHTLAVVRTVGRWLEIQRELGNSYKEFDACVEAATQCRLNGMHPEHVSAATDLIVDIYLNRG